MSKQIFKEIAIQECWPSDLPEEFLVKKGREIWSKINSEHPIEAIQLLDEYRSMNEQATNHIKEIEGARS